MERRLSFSFNVCITFFFADVMYERAETVAVHMKFCQRKMSFQKNEDKARVQSEKTRNFH